MGTRKYYIALLLIFLSLKVVISQPYPTGDLERDKEKNPILTEKVAHEIANEYYFIQIDTGAEFRINDLKGKIVIVDFWQTWCAPCIKNFKTLQKVKEKWPDKIEILAASPDWADKPRQIKRFIDRNDYDFKFVYAGELEKRLKLGSIPYKFIIDSDGELIKSVSGLSSSEDEFAFLSSLVLENMD